LTFNRLPISNGTEESDTLEVSLGFSRSRIVVDVFSTSKPLTYAFPGDTFTAKRFSEGTFPSSVLCPSVNTPSEVIPSFKDSSTSISNASTE
jgi:hypothetical protein